LPSEALKENPQLAFAIIEVKAAKAGLEYHKTDISKMPPALVKFWRELTDGNSS